MRGEGEADDGVLADAEDAAAGLAVFVGGQFEGGLNAEGGELAAGGGEEGLGVGELFDRDAAGVNGSGGRERAGRGEAEPECVAADLKPLTGEHEHLAEARGGQTQAQSRAARRQRNEAVAPRNAADEFDAEPTRAVHGGQVFRDRGIERVAVIGRQPLPDEREAHDDGGRLLESVRRGGSGQCVLGLHLGSSFAGHS